MKMEHPIQTPRKKLLKEVTQRAFSFILQSLNLSCVFQICYLMSLFPSTGMFVGEVQTLTGAGALPWDWRHVWPTGCKALSPSSCRTNGLCPSERWESGHTHLRFVEAGVSNLGRHATHKDIEMSIPGGTRYLGLGWVQGLPAPSPCQIHCGSINLGWR